MIKYLYIVNKYFKAQLGILRLLKYVEGLNFKAICCQDDDFDTII